jgi:hypothetical protein
MICGEREHKVVSHQDKLKVMRKSDKRQNMLDANKRLLGENVVSETHVDTDEGKMNYIKSALKNLSSDDLDKVYGMVEELDPEYDSGNSEWSREWMRRGGVHF